MFWDVGTPHYYDLLRAHQRTTGSPSNHHGVHVLNPDGIHISVIEDVSPSRRLFPLISGCGSRGKQRQWQGAIIRALLIHGGCSRFGTKPLQKDCPNTRGFRHSGSFNTTYLRQLKTGSPTHSACAVCGAKLRQCPAISLFAVVLRRSRKLKDV